MLHETKGEKIFKVFNTILLTLLSLTFIIPFWFVLTGSFLSEAEVARRGLFVLFPEEFYFGAYKMLLSGSNMIYRAYGVTIFVVVVGTFLNLLITAGISYSLSRPNLPGKKFFVTYIFITMLFSGGLVPTFLFNKSLGLIDNIWVLILPSLVSQWNLFVLRNFFATIPYSLEESAMIDGATPIQVFFSIMLPLSLPAMATIGLFYAVAHWNAWFAAEIYINDRALLPIQNVMRRIVLSNDMLNINVEMQSVSTSKPMSATIKSAVIIVSTIPILFIYPSIQKYFMKGMLVGSVKG